MNRTLCIIKKFEDEQWIKKLPESGKKEYFFIAPTFEGQLLAEKLNIKADSCEKIAWSLNKTVIHDLAREMSSEWLNIKSITNDPKFEALNNFQQYPLLLMHYSKLTLSFMEILESWQYTNKIIEYYEPESIVCGQYAHPMGNHENYLFAISGSNGLELEVLKIVAKLKNIDIEFVPLVIAVQNSSQRPRITISKLWQNRNRLHILLYNRIKNKIKDWLNRYKLISNRIVNLRQVDFIINCYGGYYFDQIKPAIVQLSKQFRIALNITGGCLNEQERVFLKNLGIQNCYSDNVHELKRTLKNKTILVELTGLVEAFKDVIQNNYELINYFSDRYGSFYELILVAIKRELNELPLTFISLYFHENMYTQLQPRAVLSQFDMHPLEASAVLSAQKLGIVTIGMDHGVGGLRNALRIISSSDYGAITGHNYYKYLQRIYGKSYNMQKPIGDLRIEQMSKLQIDRNQAKQRFGFDEKRRLVLFCDNSGWRSTTEWRNSEFEHLRQLIAFKQERPEVQLIYRVHHGSDTRALRYFFDNNNIEGISFQESPNPPFEDIIHAIDICISHYSSSIAESLTCGVPVVYLHALSEVEPSVMGFDMIKSVSSFAELGTIVDQLLALNLSKDEVRQQAMPYLNEAVCGNDGYATDRMVEMITTIMSQPYKGNSRNFEGWRQKLAVATNTKFSDINYT